MTARFIIVSAANDYYMPLAGDFLRSVRQLKLPFDCDIGILDIGLGDDAKKRMAHFGATIKPAKIDIDYPGREAWERQAFFFRALTARPFLPDYFPGYDAYMWMDADAWAQTPEAIENMLPAAAASDAIHIAMECDRDYPPFLQGKKLWSMYEGWYRKHFPAYLADDMSLRPMLNCGIWAASPRAPVWSKWAQVLTPVLRDIPEFTRENFMSDQLSMNVACYLGGVPFCVMPAEYNWMTLFAVPIYDEARRMYVRPGLPHTPVSLLHLNHNGKLAEMEIGTLGGGSLKRALTFAAFEAGKTDS